MKGTNANIKIVRGKFIVDNIIKSGKPAGALVPCGVTDVEGYFRDNA